MLKIYSMILIATFLSASYAANAPSFRSDYIYNEEFEAFYKEYHITQNWSEAVAICEAEGAELLVPTSQQEIEVVLSLTKNNSKIFWLGVHDIFAEGHHETLNGTVIEDIYSNWAPNEPNDFENNQNCVALMKTGKYKDIDCKLRHLFICKKLASGITQNEMCNTHDSEYVYNNVTERCYKFHSVPLSWHAAYRTCRSEKSYLAIINSEDEANHFKNLFSKYPAKTLNGNFAKEVLLMGFSDLINSGVYRTIEGKFLTDAGYDKWEAHQPDNYKNAEHCGSMFRTGGLNDINCQTRAMYICEKPIIYLNNNVNLFARFSTDQLK